jgi:hypothetical protein
MNSTMESAQPTFWNYSALKTFAPLHSLLSLTLIPLIIILIEWGWKSSGGEWKENTKTRERKWYQIYLLIWLWWIVSDSSPLMNYAISCHTSGNDWYFIIFEEKLTEFSPSGASYLSGSQWWAWEKLAETKKIGWREKWKDKCFV